MNEDAERKLLIGEIITLEETIVQTGSTNIDFSSDPKFLEEFTTSDLRAIKTRFDRLVRTLGSVKRQ